MKKIFLLTFIIVLIVRQSYAQDWQCVHDSTVYNYLGPSNDIWAVRIDSTALKEGYKYYYGFRINRLVSDSTSGPYEFYCVNPNGPSRMGVALSVGEAGNFFFNSEGDGIRFRTDLQPNIPWICCRITDSTRLDAMVTLAQTETVLGIVDSVKYISFQAKRNTGELISHPINDQVFKLSKKFGMITLFDFFKFPEYDSNYYPVHNLAGVSSPGSSIGVQNLTSREIYSFAPGDEFHIFYMSFSGPHGDGAQERTVKTVLDSTWNPSGDRVHYRFRRLMDFWLGTSSDPHQYSCDTILETFAVHGDACTGLENQPEQTVFCMDGPASSDFVTWHTQYRNSKYNFRWVKETGSHYVPCSFCADTLAGLVGGYFGETGGSYYIEGCGSGYYQTWWTDDYHDTYTTYNLLQYFRKGSETWGIPFDTTNWHHPNSVANIFGENGKVLIYPNPTYETVTLEIPGFSGGENIVELCTIEGSVLKEIMFAGGKTTFSISSINKGMYILKVFRDKQLLGRQKLVKL
jgi:hypothetical protein